MALLFVRFAPQPSNSSVYFVGFAAAEERGGIALGFRTPPLTPVLNSALLPLVATASAHSAGVRTAIAPILKNI